MKFGFKDYWVECDAKETYTQIKEQITKLFQEIENRFVKKQITIAFIDDRYYLTGYIISYCILSITSKELEDLLNEIATSRHWTVDCKDCLTKEEYQKYVIYDSDELNGYETDVPTNFDIFIK